jgi:hypothetical protein
MKNINRHTRRVIHLMDMAPDKFGLRTTRRPILDHRQHNPGSGRNSLISGLALTIVCIAAVAATFIVFRNC